MRRGAILFLAVGSIAILSILALGATSSVSRELRAVKFLTEANTSFYYALSAMEVMKGALRGDATPFAVTLYDLRPRTLDLDGNTVEITSGDEAARINCITAPAEVLLRLAPLAGHESLVNAIKAHPPVVKEDLLFIEGMTPDIYADLKDLVTTYGSGSVNINTASPETLLALGLEKDFVEKIQSFRAGADAEAGTDDDGSFSDFSKIIPVLETCGLTESARKTIEALVTSGQLVTGSNSIAFAVKVKKVKELRSFKAVVDLPTGTVFSWEEQ